MSGLSQNELDALDAFDKEISALEKPGNGNTTIIEVASVRLNQPVENPKEAPTESAIQLQNEYEKEAQDEEKQALLNELQDQRELLKRVEALKEKRKHLVNSVDPTKTEPEPTKTKEVNIDHFFTGPHSDDDDVDDDDDEHFYHFGGCSCCSRGK